MLSAVGRLEHLVVLVGRGHGDHVRVGGREERHRKRALVAGGRHQDDALLTGIPQAQLDAGIAAASEAHVDDARAAVGRPVDRLGDHIAVPLRLILSAIEGLRRQDAGCGRAAFQPRVRRDRTGHRGSMRMTLVACTRRIEGIFNHALQLRVRRINATVHDRNENITAPRQHMRLRQPHLGERILFERRRARGNRWLAIEAHDVVQRNGDGAAVGLDRANHGRSSSATQDARSIKSGACARNIERVELREAEALRQQSGGLIGSIGGELDHHFIGQIVAIVDGRQATDARTAERRGCSACSRDRRATSTRRASKDDRRLRDNNRRHRITSDDDWWLARAPAATDRALGWRCDARAGGAAGRRRMTLQNGPGRVEGPALAGDADRRDLCGKSVNRQRGRNKRSCDSERG